MRDGDDVRLDARIQAYLDGELDVGEAQAVERLMRERPDLARRVAAIERMQAWLGLTRPESPRAVADAVRAALESTAVRSREQSERSPAEIPATPEIPRESGRSMRLPAWLRPRWVMAAAAVAIGVLLLSHVKFGSDRVVTEGSRASDSREASVRYDFCFGAPGAREVCLVGEFNGWTVCTVPLTRQDDGVWHVSLELAPGRYQYMFVVDGEWVTDPQAAVHVDDGYGRMNAVAFLWGSSS